MTACGLFQKKILQMKELDEILYDAIRASEEIMQAVGDRVVSTCFEVGPDDIDNTDLPCIIVTDDGLENHPETKDSCWEGSEDHVLATIEIDARSPREVQHLRRLCRKAVAEYIQTQSGQIPYLDSVRTSQRAWDWMKPCYHQELTYECTVYNSQL